MINVTKQDTVGIIEIDRPQRRNALDVEHCHGLREAMGMVLADHARAVVLTGAGSSFCSGADLGEVYGSAGDDKDLRAALYPALHAISDAPVPVVAAVNGPAIGAGTQLAIACDLRVAAPGATFAVPTARIGLAVDPWTIRRLAALAGGGLARRMLLAAAAVPAEQAVAGGLVDRLGGRDDAVSWAAEIAELAPLTLSYSKRALDHPDDPRLAELFEECWTDSSRPGRPVP